MIERFITQLSKELELPRELQPKSPGVYVLPLEVDLSITFTEKDGVIYFHSVVAPVPPGSQEAFLESMLLANLFGQGTYGATLGLDEEAKNIVLQRTFDYPLDYRQFRDHVEDFVNALDLWREEAQPKV
jgi:hypothetical protein